MDDKRLPYKISNPPWNSMDEETVGPSQPAKIDTDDSNPKNFLGEFSVNSQSVDRKKYPGAAPHITRVHDPKGD